MQCTKDGIELGGSFIQYEDIGKASFCELENSVHIHLFNTDTGKHIARMALSPTENADFIKELHKALVNHGITPKKEHTDPYEKLPLEMYVAKMDNDFKNAVTIDALKKTAGFSFKWLLFKAIALAAGAGLAYILMNLGASIYEILSGVIAGALIAGTMYKMVYTRPENKWLANMVALAGIVMGFFVYCWLFDWAGYRCQITLLRMVIFLAPITVAVYLAVDHCFGLLDAKVTGRI